MLDSHVPPGYFDGEESDLRANVWSKWQTLAQLAEDTSDQLAEVQGPFKRVLNRDIKEFVKASVCRLVDRNTLRFAMKFMGSTL